VIHENKIFISVILNFFPFVNCAIDPLYDPLRSEASLKPCISFLYETSSNKSNLNILFQNVRSLHLHVEDAVCDYSVQARVNILVERALCSTDTDEAYDMTNFCLYRNDCDPQNTTWTTYGTAVYIRNDVECTVTPLDGTTTIQKWLMLFAVYLVITMYMLLGSVGIYHSKTKVVFSKLVEALEHLHRTILSEPQTPVIILWDLETNVNFMQVASELKLLWNIWSSKKVTLSW